MSSSLHLLRSLTIPQWSMPAYAAPSVPDADPQAIPSSCESPSSDVSTPLSSFQTILGFADSVGEYDQGAQKPHIISGARCTGSMALWVAANSTCCRTTWMR